MINIPSSRPTLTQTNQIKTSQTCNSGKIIPSQISTGDISYMQMLSLLIAMIVRLLVIKGK